MFRTKRSKARARVRGAMLAAQWIEEIRRPVELECKRRARVSDIAQRIEAAKRLLPHMTRERMVEWVVGMIRGIQWAA